MTQPRLLGGRYELDGIVGRGGMAEVFRARDIRLDRIVAVKTLRDDLARDQTFQARFRREAQSAASLNHPSIVAVYDTGEDMVGPTPVPYIVMEYVDGRTLRDLLRDDRRLLPERALEITDGVLRALDYSHRNGIVHRDIKPGNVMLTRTGDVKVMDFGIARAVSDAQATMTQTAQVIGTAQYLSPEQARGERVDARSDLYSTGCLLYELLTGRPPFTGDSPVAIAYQHVRENPVPPSRVDPEIPAWADSIVLKAMEKDPADRYQSAGEMRNDIQRALQGMPLAAAATHTVGYQGTRRMDQPTRMAGATSAIPPYEYGPAGGPRDFPRRKKWPWVLAALVAVAIIAGLVYAFSYVSGPGSSYSVPNVANLPLKTAEADIAKAHLVSQVVNQPSSTVPKGDVINTSPPFGTTVGKNSTVKLFVSTGAAKVAVPSVVGENQATATSQLQAAGFVVDPKSAPNSTAPSGTVVRQNPPAGTQVARNSTVTIYVSGGGVKVPSVIGYPQSTAQQILKGDGFNVITKVVAGPAGSTPGNVFDQTPNGVPLPTGGTVTIYVAMQPTPSPTPTTSSPSPSPSPSATSPSPSPSPTQ
ncbi:MAG TPA: Stk1 family PASTA domain-containing Ser/Thr kinase [Streptosporangiaceae bacterium]|jgi:serine/threonine-protein kinase|nr:Stk1 family PASTA domain-containing Ser/Thr kinase [Streptosporangiaceae bacterium]